MEANLIAAYKSLAAVKADPQISVLGPEAADSVSKMMASIKGALVTIATKRAALEVEEALK